MQYQLQKSNQNQFLENNPNYKTIKDLKNYISSEPCRHTKAKKHCYSVIVLNSPYMILNEILKCTVKK